MRMRKRPLRIYDYNSADYYSDHTIAENNARADKLMRQLRRFAVEHREDSFDWHKCTASKYFITYHHPSKNFSVFDCALAQTFGAIYFNSSRIANLAIETFRDELIWYFTEYKDSL